MRVSRSGLAGARGIRGVANGFVFAIAFASLAAATLPLGRTYVCYWSPGPITVDGRLDDSAWASAPWSEEFIDIVGDTAPAPPLRTRFKLLWDSTYLYVAAELEEPHVWATLTARDAVVYRDNDFEVFIDPDGDGLNYYEIEINALGTVWDLLLVRPYRQGGPAITAWDIRGLQSAVHVDGTVNDPSDTDQGWTVEMALPWSVLVEAARGRRPPQDGTEWRMNFSRVQWDLDVVDGEYRKTIEPSTNRPRREHNWVWSPQGVVDMHLPERWGTVRFSSVSPQAREP